MNLGSKVRLSFVTALEDGPLTKSFMVTLGTTLVPMKNNSIRLLMNDRGVQSGCWAGHKLGLPSRAQPVSSKKMKARMNVKPINPTTHQNSTGQMVC